MFGPRKIWQPCSGLGGDNYRIASAPNALTVKLSIKLLPWPLTLGRPKPNYKSGGRYYYFLTIFAEKSAQNLLKLLLVLAKI
jgi:hypothetical protein